MKLKVPYRHTLCHLFRAWNFYFIETTVIFAMLLRILTFFLLDNTFINFFSLLLTDIGSGWFMNNTNV